MGYRSYTIVHAQYWSQSASSTIPAAEVAWRICGGLAMGWGLGGLYSLITGPWPEDKKHACIFQKLQCFNLYVEKKTSHRIPKLWNPQQGFSWSNGLIWCADSPDLVPSPQSVWARNRTNMNKYIDFHAAFISSSRALWSRWTEANIVSQEIQNSSSRQLCATSQKVVSSLPSDCHHGFAQSLSITSFCTMSWLLLASNFLYCTGWRSDSSLNLL